MTRKILGAVLLAFALSAGTAQGDTTILEPIGSKFPYQQWVAGAHVPTPDVTVSLVEAPCPELPSALGCTDGSTIWIAPSGVEEHWRPRETLYHEIGHLFDMAYLTPQLRHSFRALVKANGPWFTSSHSSSDPGEKFAEDYAACALDRPNFSAISEAPYRPPVCRLITSAVNTSA